MTRTFDPFDELAAMFLSAPAATTSAPRPPAASSSPLIELLIAGHLPVRAGLWLTPYADVLAREHGATALLRLDGDEPSLQILRGPPSLATASLGQSLEQCVRSAGSEVDLWVIRTGGSTSPQDLARIDADRITILSSADEAAVVSAYQIIKSLFQAAQELQRTLPPVALAVVGAEHRDALAVVDRLNRTTVSFLGVQVRLAMCLPRMDAGIKSTRYLGFPGNPCPTLGAAIGMVQQARATASMRDRHAPVAGTAHAERAEADPSDLDRLLRICPATPPKAAPPPIPALAPRTEAPVSAVAPMTAAQPALDAFIANQSSESANAAASIRIKLSPKPSMNVEPKRPAATIEPDDDGRPVPLATHVAGLRMMPARAPGHERVELAVDAAGRLHLLAREASLRDLPVVERWAHQHHELLAMACPEHRIDRSEKPACHIFTGEPASLADLHGSGLHLHVLAPVLVNGTMAWYAAPLNAVR